MRQPYISQRMLRVDSHPQKLGRWMVGFCPESQKKMTPLTPWFWTFAFRSCERIHSCCFRPTSLWYFVMATVGNEYKSFHISNCSGLQSWSGLMNSSDRGKLGLLTEVRMGRRVRNKVVLIHVNGSVTWPTLPLPAEWWLWVGKVLLPSNSE